MGDPWPPTGGPAAGSGGTTTTSGSAQTSIFDIPTGLKPDSQITTDYGRTRRDLPGRLDQYDRQIAEKSLRPPVVGRLEDALKEPITAFAKDPKKYLNLQRALFAAGFFGDTPEKSIQWGAGVEQTMAAWRRVIIATAQAQAAGQSLTPVDVMNRALEGRKASAGPGGASLVRQHEDPKAVAGILQRAAQASLGRNLSTAEVEHFISEYRSAEDAYYTQGEKADVTPGIHNLTKPDLEAQADAFVQGGHGTEMAGESMGAYADALLRMVEGG